MPKFNYTGRSEGKVVKGEVVAPNADSVVEQLLNRRIEPISIDPVAGSGGNKGGGGGELAMFIEWPSDDDLILFTRQMFTLSKAGVSLIRSFQGLAESTNNKKLVEAMEKMSLDLQAGQELSTAMSEHPKIFDKLYIRIIRMGEETGRMEDSFQQLFEYMEVDKETRKQIKSALRYPTFVIIAIVIAMFIVNYFVIPAFAGMFSRFGSELPLATRILLGTSKFTQDYAAYIIVFLGGVVYGFKYWSNTTAGRLKWDHQKLKLPIVGSIINRATMARFARSFTMGARAGLPVIQVLTAVSEAVGNSFVESKIKEMRAGIERGESLTQSAYNSELFTPLVLQMMSVGEETGGMEEMMQEVAEFYEREVSYDVKGLSSAIEPILLTVIGAMVLVLALGIFLPMWDMGSAATGKK
ncbi:MAG: type II secretion system F family protein [Magnetococcales bacterium]|nr:type II secretion system F family protein [Magnetococcales bacterium]